VDSTGAGADLVLLHGWGMHSGAWDEIVPLLARRYRVHAIDLPGHGRSSHVAAGPFDEAAGRVAERIPRGAHVCGWSLGGLVAQRIAARDGPRIGRVVLVAATPCFAERPGWDAAMKQSTLEEFAAGLALDREGTLARFVRLNALNGALGREAIRAFTHRLAARGTPSPASLEASIGWLREVDLRGEAAAIAAPVLVVHGARDMLAPVEAGRWLARNLPDARLLEIADAAHLPFFSHREAFVRAVEAHLG
jgi:pimeloyl-[acyl-carrier protein] methyl ester esterase